MFYKVKKGAPLSLNKAVRAMSNTVLDCANFYEKQESKIPKGNTSRADNCNMLLLGSAFCTLCFQRGS